MHRISKKYQKGVKMEKHLLIKGLSESHHLDLGHQARPPLSFCRRFCSLRSPRTAPGCVAFGLLPIAHAFTLFARTFFFLRLGLLIWFPHLAHCTFPHSSFAHHALMVSRLVAIHSTPLFARSVGGYSSTIWFASGFYYKPDKARFVDLCTNIRFGLSVYITSISLTQSTLYHLHAGI